MLIKVLFACRSQADMLRLEGYCDLILKSYPGTILPTLLYIPDNFNYSKLNGKFRWQRLEYFLFGFNSLLILRLLLKFPVLIEHLIRPFNFEIVFSDFRFEGTYSRVLDLIGQNCKFKFIVPHGAGNSFHLMYSNFELPFKTGWVHFVNSDIEAKATKEFSIILGDILYRSKFPVDRTPGDNLVFVESGDVSQFVKFDHVLGFTEFAKSFIELNTHPHVYCVHPRNIRNILGLNCVNYNTMENINRAKLVIMDGFSSLNVDVHFNSIPCAIYCQNDTLIHYYNKLNYYGFYLFKTKEELNFIIESLSYSRKSYSSEMAELYLFRESEFINYIKDVIENV